MNASTWQDRMFEAVFAYKDAVRAGEVEDNDDDMDTEDDAEVV